MRLGGAVARRAAWPQPPRRASRVRRALSFRRGSRSDAAPVPHRTTPAPAACSWRQALRLHPRQEAWRHLPVCVGGWAAWAEGCGQRRGCLMMGADAGDACMRGWPASRWAAAAAGRHASMAANPHPSLATTCPPLGLQLHTPPPASHALACCPTALALPTLTLPRPAATPLQSRRTATTPRTPSAPASPSSGAWCLS